MDKQLALVIIYLMAPVIHTQAYNNHRHIYTHIYTYMYIHIDIERLVNNGPGWNMMDGHDTTEIKETNINIQGLTCLG